MQFPVDMYNDLSDIDRASLLSIIENRIEFDSPDSILTPLMSLLSFYKIDVGDLPKKFSIYALLARHSTPNKILSSLVLKSLDDYAEQVFLKSRDGLEELMSSSRSHELIDDSLYFSRIPSNFVMHLARESPKRLLRDPMHQDFILLLSDSTRRFKEIKNRESLLKTSAFGACVSKVLKNSILFIVDPSCAASQVREMVVQNIEICLFAKAVARMNVRDTETWSRVTARFFETLRYFNISEPSRYARVVVRHGLKIQKGYEKMVLADWTYALKRVVAMDSTTLHDDFCEAYTWWGAAP